ncbi:MAG TPA: hypothetical protein VGX76_01405, partial [Pirellulales bacterium]|nr:hypothetical protein [Pirellulales bacterium]
MAMGKRGKPEVVAERLLLKIENSAADRSSSPSQLFYQQFFCHQPSMVMAARRPEWHEPPSQAELRAALRRRIYGANS